MDSAVDRLREIMTRTFANDDCTIRYWALYTSRRISASAITNGADDRALSITRAALALPFEHLNPASIWYEHVIFLRGRTMHALHNLESCEEAISYAQKCAPPAAGHSAHAAALVARGEAFAAQGQRERANESWRECVALFEAVESEGDRTEVARARARITAN
jgi:hypothetical protein